RAIAPGSRTPTVPDQANEVDGEDVFITAGPDEVHAVWSGDDEAVGSTISTGRRTRRRPRRSGLGLRRRLRPARDDHPVSEEGFESAECRGDALGDVLPFASLQSRETAGDHETVRDAAEGKPASGSLHRS